MEDNLPKSLDTGQQIHVSASLQFQCTLRSADLWAIQQWRRPVPGKIRLLLFSGGQL
jgi:hypothetical protein